MQGGGDVAGEAQTPDFQKSLQVKQDGKSNLGRGGEKEKYSRRDERCQIYD